VEAAAALYADRPAAERQLNGQPRVPGRAATATRHACATRTRRLAAAGSCALALACGDPEDEQPPSSSEVAVHLAAALEASGAEHIALLERLCTQATGTQLRISGPLAPPPDSLPSAPDAAEAWMTAPAQVFDDLYFVGQTRYSSWAVTTLEGIVVIDPLFDYSVRGAVEGGLEQLGLDPADIRYVIVSHAHSDHAGGARYLQDTYGARVILSRADWDLLERTEAEWPKPRRDIEADDGYELALGGKTLRLYVTPGHTPGTISTIIPLSDRGEPHVAALWGGTAFNFMGRGEDETWFREYERSAERFAAVAREAGADVVLSNHPQYDGTTFRLARLAGRGPRDAHPYVIGPEGVRRFFAVAASCARAGLAAVG
jgi:metallo-beta-lactamase class B